MQTPNSTTQTNTETFFEKRNKFLLIYNDEENILRDLNARMGNEGKLNNRFTEHLDHILLLDIEENPAVERSSLDNKINQSGRTLLSLFNNYNLEITSGQTSGDRSGNFTCFNN